jgi:uncharacterized membrane protein
MIELFLFLVAVGVLAFPLAALILALVLRHKLSQLRATVERSELERGSSRRWLERLQRRVETLERDAGVAGPEPAPPPPARETAGVEAPKPEKPPVAPAAPRIPEPETPAAQEPAAVTPPPPPVSTAPARPSRAGIERQLGTRVAVWLGAVALALAGGFLVKYTFDQGLLGPAARVTLGLVFGVALLGVAEWLRQRLSGVAQGLAAAGVAVLYAALLAGVNLYHLIPVVVGFAGMALVTATAVVLALRHGQIVAILGLLGGFLTPAWIGTDQPRPWMLLLYLLLLQVGLLVVSRKRRWAPVAMLTLAGAVIWGFLWIAGLEGMGGSTLPVGLFLLCSAAAFVFSATPEGESRDWKTLYLPNILGWGGAGAAVILTALLVGVGDFGVREWVFLGILGAGCLVLGRKEPRYEGLAWLAALSSAGMLLIWGLELDPEYRLRIWSVTLSLGAVFVGGSYLAMWGSSRPDRWAALSAVSGIVFLLVGYRALHEPAYPIPWGIQSLIVAGAFVAMAFPLMRRRDEGKHLDTALAALAVAVTAFVSLSIPMELERAWITVAWALEVPALAWIATRLRLPALDKLALGLAGVVVVRLLLNPAVLDYPIGEGLPFNWLLYGYGIPIVSFAVGALLFRRLGRERSASILEGGAIVFGFAFLTLQIRQYFHAGDIGATRFELAEFGAFTVVWLLYGLALMLLHRSTERRLHLTSGAVIGTIGIVQGLLVQGLFRSPLFHADPVGTMMIFNVVLFAFGLPAILALFLARELSRAGEVWPARLAGVASLLFAFLTLSLEARQAFQGSLLDSGEVTNAEMYTYSLVWILFGTALLVAGIVTRGHVLRYGSAAVMLLAVGKVFLVDTANLQDLYRVFSLFGLGVSLMILAFLYQRYVFGGGRS